MADPHYGMPPDGNSMIFQCLWCFEQFSHERMGHLGLKDRNHSLTAFGFFFMKKKRESIWSVLRRFETDFDNFSCANTFDFYTFVM